MNGHRGSQDEGQGSEEDVKFNLDFINDSFVAPHHKIDIAADLGVESMGMIVDVDFQDLESRQAPILHAYIAGTPTSDDPNAVLACAAYHSVLRAELAVFFEVHDSIKMSLEGIDLPPNHYQINRHTLIHTDLAVFSTDATNFDVGVEVQIAIDATIPNIICHPINCIVSPMVHGALGQTLKEIQYSGLQDLQLQLREVLPQIKDIVMIAAKLRRLILQRTASPQLGRQLMGARLLKTKTRSELANVVGLSEAQIYELEHIPSVTNVVTVMQLARLAEQLQLTFTLGCGHNGGPELFNDYPGWADSVVNVSLTNLLDFAYRPEHSGDQSKREDRTSKDRSVVQIWSEYLEDQRATIKARGNFEKPVSMGEWENRYLRLRRR